MTRVILGRPFKLMGKRMKSIIVLKVLSKCSSIRLINQLLVWVEEYCTSALTGSSKIFVKATAALFVVLVHLKLSSMMNTLFLTGFSKNMASIQKQFVCLMEVQSDMINIKSHVVNNVMGF